MQLSLVLVLVLEIAGLGLGVCGLGLGWPGLDYNTDIYATRWQLINGLKVKGLMRVVKIWASRQMKQASCLNLCSLCTESCECQNIFKDA